jgi:hypothetical protein
MVVESLYENVKRHTMEHRELRAGEPEENVVLQFKPEPAQTMYIACLWSHWTDSKEPPIGGPAGGRSIRDFYPSLDLRRK